MEELGSEDDYNPQAVGSTSTALSLSRRVTSDSLRFTGGDMGGGNTRSRKAYAYQNGEDEETTDESEPGSDGEDGVRMGLLDPEEEALADRAMARIQKAHAKGRTDVKLSKEELAAYQRRLQRMAEEERRPRRERVAIPISQLGPGLPPQRQLMEDDSPPPSQQPSPEPGADQQAPSPQMGYFPPPSSRTRPRPGPTSSRPPSRAPSDREPSSSPFTYTYVRGEPPTNSRQPSDSATSRPLSVAEPVSARGGGSPGSDPFQYMQAGARTSYHGAPASARNSVGDVDDIYASYGSGPAGGPSRRQSSGPREPELSDEDDDRRRVVARVNSGTVSRSRHRDSTDSRREAAPESRSSRDKSPPPAKKSSSTSSTVAKRKSVSSSAKPVRKKK